MCLQSFCCLITGLEVFCVICMSFDYYFEPCKLMATYCHGFYLLSGNIFLMNVLNLRFFLFPFLPFSPIIAYKLFLLSIYSDNKINMYNINMVLITMYIMSSKGIRNLDVKGKTLIFFTASFKSCFLCFSCYSGGGGVFYKITINLKKL